MYNISLVLCSADNGKKSGYCIIACILIFFMIYFLFFYFLKVLQREVGENISFHNLLNSSAGWRGRQQQIMTLQQKVFIIEHKSCFVGFLEG